ncbi:hypothetical protein GY977_23720, partial [Escherichia coli]|nr:hypothetical protein [Escherichia coli]
ATDRAERPEMAADDADLRARRASRAMIPGRTIPRAKIEVSEIGFGAAPLGNLYHPISDLQAGTTLERALTAGMNYVDTA